MTKDEMVTDIDVMTYIMTNERNKFRDESLSGQCIDNKHKDWLANQEHTRMRILGHLQDVKNDLKDLHDLDDYFNKEN